MEYNIKIDIKYIYWDLWTRLIQLSIGTNGVVL
jgi:hypothetical protein